MRLRVGHAHILRQPLAPGAHEGKIQTHAHGLRPQLFRQLRVTLELRAVALDLALQKLLPAAARVLARLVVDDPANSVLVDEASVEDHPPPLAPPLTRDGIFAKVIPIATPQYPASTWIAVHADQCRHDA